MHQSPAWWAEAQRLRADGAKLADIAAQFGKHPSTALRATNPYSRRKQSAAKARLRREKREAKA